MPWVHRGKQSYYYRSLRRNGKVVRQYVGKGEAAAEEAAATQRRRHEREAHRTAAHEYQQGHAEADAALDRLIEITDLLARATLTDLGYHLHARVWRKRRGENH
jgi:hypothetical protein